MTCRTGSSVLYVGPQGSNQVNILSIFVFLPTSSFWDFFVPGKTFSVTPGFAVPELSGPGHWHPTSFGAGHRQPGGRWRGGDVDHGFDRHNQLFFNMTFGYLTFLHEFCFYSLFV